MSDWPRYISTGSTVFATGAEARGSRFESIVLSTATRATTAIIAGGVSELRIDVGPGYRVYDTQRRDEFIVLLAGGDKSSQQQDIRRPIELAEYLQESGHAQDIPQADREVEDRCL